MTVKLEARVNAPPAASVGITHEKLDAEMEGGSALEVGIEPGARLKAGIGKGPRASISSTSVAVPVANDYEALYNKPSIEGVELEGDKSFVDLGLLELTNEQILNIWNIVQGSE